MSKFRKTAIKALVGSHNYNLNDINSDKDYKYFVYPLFNDLYSGTFYNFSNTSDDCDYTIHDIRKLPELCKKANINFLEVLFSKELEVNCEILSYFIEDYKNDIAKMNISYLISACHGMYFNKMKYLEKGTATTLKLVKSFGYDTKQALHAYRCLDFIERFIEFDLDFQKALEYSLAESIQLLNIKHGLYSKDAFDELIKYKYKKFEKYLELKNTFEFNQQLYETLCDYVKDSVKNNLGMF